MKIEKYELMSLDRKSFYGKASVLFVNGKKLLLSYGTIVCGLGDSGLERYWDGYSATTLRHVCAFADRRISKKEWTSMPIHEEDY